MKGLGKTLQTFRRERGEEGSRIPENSLTWPLPTVSTKCSALHYTTLGLVSMIIVVFQTQVGNFCIQRTLQVQVCDVFLDNFSDRRPLILAKTKVHRPEFGLQRLGWGFGFESNNDWRLVIAWYYSTQTDISRYFCARTKTQITQRLHYDNNNSLHTCLSVNVLLLTGQWGKHVKGVHENT